MRVIRKNCELSIEDLARVLGCSTSTVYRFESGHKEPKLEHAVLLVALRECIGGNPKRVRRLRQALASSGRLAVLSLILRTGQMTGHLTY